MPASVRQEHTLRNTSSFAMPGAKNKGGTSGECIVCREEGVVSKSTNLQCDVCLNGKGKPGAYLHLPCFFKSHVCYKRK